MPAPEPQPGPHPPTRPALPQPGRPADPEPRLGLSLSQIAGSALAAASAAFGASYLGVAGTIIGAAVASVIATVATAMYTSSLQRTRHVVRSTVTQWTGTATTAPAAGPEVTRELPVAPEPGRRPPRRLPWTRLAVAATAVLVITLGALTGVEGLAGKPLSSLLGGSDATGTTISSVGGAGGWAARTHTTKTSRPTTVSAPASTPTTPTTTPTSQPTTTPTAQPTDAGTTTATPTPSPSPTSEPTATPTP